MKHDNPNSTDQETPKDLLALRLYQGKQRKELRNSIKSKLAKLDLTREQRSVIIDHGLTHYSEHESFNEALQYAISCMEAICGTRILSDCPVFDRLKDFPEYQAIIIEGLLFSLDKPNTVTLPRAQQIIKTLLEERSILLGEMNFIIDDLIDLAYDTHCGSNDIARANILDVQKRLKDSEFLNDAFPQWREKLSEISKTKPHLKVVK